jgi:hypothetical protein
MEKKKGCVTIFLNVPFTSADTTYSYTLQQKIFKSDNSARNKKKKLSTGQPKNTQTLNPTAIYPTYIYSRFFAQSHTTFYVVLRNHLHNDQPLCPRSSNLTHHNLYAITQPFFNMAYYCCILWSIRDHRVSTVSVS